MLAIKEYVDIKNYCTFKVGGQCRYFTEVHDVAELPALYQFAQEKNIPVHILGGGSNIVFPDGVFEKVVVHIQFEGFEIIHDEENYTDIKIGAGENWDSVVARTVAMNLSGIEALSAIPGTTGATPVQNVGAYGQEIKDTLVSLEVFDTTKNVWKTFTNAECEFSYRNSIFKGKEKRRYVITSTILRLLKVVPTIPQYPEVKKYFDEKKITNPTLQEIRSAIIAIRSIKLPNPKEISNVGSFFKNPIVQNETAKKLMELYPTMITFSVDKTHTKVPAGFLIETAGLKGKKFGTISSYVNNAMVLINTGGATRSDVENTRDEIIKIVFDKFGILLEAEPEFV